MKPIAIACDIDSTLADTSYRARKMIKKNREETDWLAYAQACDSDVPTATVDLLRLLHPYYTIVLVTARPIQALPQTRSWLERHEVPFDFLIMDEGNFEHSSDYKVAAIEQVSLSYEVALVIDDWWSHGEAIKDALGIPSVIVRSYAPEVLEPAF